MGFLRNNSDRRTLKVIGVGLGMLIVTGLIPVFAPALMEGLLVIPTVMILIFVTLALIVSIIPGEQQPKSAAEKQKRGLEGADMYSMIDRLVDELDGDEMAYLRKRLEVHEQGSDRDLSHSLEVLLDKRSAVGKEK